MDKSTFAKLSPSNKLGTMFEFLVGMQSMADKNIADMTSKVDTACREIKHATKQVSDRVDELVRKVVGLERGLGKVEEKTVSIEVEARELKARVQEKVTVQDEKIEKLEIELTKVDSYQTNKELNDIKSQIATMLVSLNCLRSEMDDLLHIKEALHNDTATSREPLDAWPLATTPQIGFAPSVHAICNELRQREKKLNNLVVFGLSESNHDVETIQELVTTVGTYSEISSTFRVGQEMEGRPRPLVICFATKQGRDHLYSNLRNLRGRVRWNKVSVVPDLTKLQYMEERRIYLQLLEEATKRNDESEEGNGLWKVIGSRGSKRIVK